MMTTEISNVSNSQLGHLGRNIKRMRLCSLSSDRSQLVSVARNKTIETTELKASVKGIHFEL